MVKDQPFIGGVAATYADYALFGTLQWARCTSGFRVVAADDPIHAWFERVLDMHNGVGRGEPAAV